MINPVTNFSQHPFVSPICLGENFSSPITRSSLTSLQAADGQPSYLKKAIRILFYPFIFIYEWIFSRISLSTGEYAALEEIIVDFGKAYVDLIYERKKGENTLRSVIERTKNLLEGVEKKWFPKLKGLLFLKGNLLKLLMRAHATLKNGEELEKTGKRLFAMGGEIDPNLEADLRYMQILSAEQFRPIGWFINKMTQFAVAMYFWKK